jgi:hypothetical protein
LLVLGRNHDHVLSLFTGLMFNRYVPAVTVCTTTACCSDNTAYHEQGFSSTFIFESCPGEPEETPDQARSPLYS